MAGAWDAKVEISTADATLNLRNLKTEAAGLAAALRALDTELVAGQKNIQAVAASFTELVVAQRQAAAAQRDLSAASIAQARTDAITIANNEKIATGEAQRTLLEERRNTVALQGEAVTQRMAVTDEAAALRRDQAAQRDIANTERVTAAEARRAETATRAARSANTDLTLSDNLSNSRYLLYDVGATYGVLSATLLAIPMLTAAVAASYQKDFAQVLRVTHESAAQSDVLRQSLKDLATQIPLSFGELANITQIGAQMGIATDKLANFTEVTAKFTATTGVATETAATLFGRLQNMFPEESKAPGFFNSIGSAIAQVGADTVATDPQIAAMSVQIAAVGSSAGFTAAQTIGLSAALASVAVQPELARGTLTRVFGKLNTDVATGSTKLAEFGKVMGITSQQASALWQADPSTFFQNLVKGLHDIQAAQGGVGLTQALSGLGITSVRDVSTLTRLAVGYDTLATSMTSADNAAKNGTALDAMSKPVFSTMASQLKEISAAIQNLMDTMGTSSLGPVTQFLDLIKGLITGFDGLIRQVPAFQVLLGIGAVLAIVAGAFLAMKTAQAFALAGLVGFQQVAGKQGLSGAMSLKGVLEQLVKTWLMAGKASSDAATEMLASSGIIRSAALAAAGGAESLNTPLAEGATRTVGFSAGLKGVTASLIGLAGGPIGIAIMGLTALIFAFGQSTAAADAAGKAIADGMAAGAQSGLQAITTQLQQMKVDTFNGGGGSMIFAGDMGKSMQDLANETNISFDKVVAAISKGTGAGDAFKVSLDQIAQNKGFKDFKDWNASSPFGGLDTDLSRLNTLNDTVTRLGNSSAKSAADTKQAADTTAKLGGNAAGAIDPVTGVATGLDANATAATNADKALKTYMDDLFGTMDAAMGTSDALEKLGAGLQKSTSLNMNDANGRDNLKNLEDAMRKAATEQQNMINSGQETAQQAAANYSTFIAGLMKKLTAMGVDTSQIQALADQAASAFGDQIANAPKAKLTPTVDMAPAKAQTQSQVTDFLAGIDSFIKANPTAAIKISTDSDSMTAAERQVFDLATYISKQTGIPFRAVVDALVNPAADKAKEVSDYMTKLMAMQYTAGIDADTSAAIAKVQAFAAYAHSVMASTSNTVGVLAPTASNFANLSQGKFSNAASPASSSAPSTGPAAPPMWNSQSSSTDTSATADATSGLDALTNGYNNAAAAATKAGSAGAAAGKNAASGIGAATAAVNDYAARLQTSLTSAYDKQYGMQIATDNYQKALNAIVDKRAADLKSIQDLIDKQKQLNDAMNTELVDANKAKIEQAISLKYGEGARAADYGNKAQTALDNAAAKKKEMDADAASQKVLQDGLGDLTSNTNAAIANREAVRGLETQMLAMVDAYAKTGASQQQVTAYAQQLSGQFQRDVVQTGFNQQAIQNLTGDMGRYRSAVLAVPTTVNTNVSTSGTPQAVGQLAAVKAAANAIPTDVWTAYHYIGDYLTEMPGNQASNYQPIYQKFDQAGHNTGAKYFNEGGQVQGFASGGQIPGTPPSNPRADNLMAQVDGKGMIRVRSKEFIQPQEAVDYYGLDFMNQIRKMQLPRFNFGGQVGGSGGGAGRAGSGPMLVELTAQNIAAIARLADRDINLYTNDELLAQSVGRGNTVLASKGFS